MMMGDENRHRELHGQFRHSATPTMHSPRISMPRIYMGNHRLLTWNKQSFFDKSIFVCFRFSWRLQSRSLWIYLTYFIICIDMFNLSIFIDCLFESMEWLTFFFIVFSTFLLNRLFKNMNELLCFDSVVFLVVPKYRQFDQYIISIWNL